MLLSEANLLHLLYLSDDIDCIYVIVVMVGIAVVRLVITVVITS